MPRASGAPKSQRSRILRRSVLALAMFAAAPTAQRLAAQPLAERTVRNEVRVRVGLAMRVLDSATTSGKPREDGTRELRGSVRVATNVPCVLRVQAGGVAEEYQVDPGISSRPWRLTLTTSESASVRYELRPARELVTASSPR